MGVGVRLGVSYSVSNDHLYVHLGLGKRLKVKSGMQ